MKTTTTVITYEYDEQGRVSKATTVVTEYGGETWAYGTTTTSFPAVWTAGTWTAGTVGTWTQPQITDKDKSDDSRDDE